MFRINVHAGKHTPLQGKFVLSTDGWMDGPTKIPLLSCIFETMELMEIVLNEMEVLVVLRAMHCTDLKPNSTHSSQKHTHTHTHTYGW